MLLSWFVLLRYGVDGGPEEINDGQVFLLRGKIWRVPPSLWKRSAVTKKHRTLTDTHTHTHTHTASLYTYIWMGIYISPFGHIIIIIKKNRRRQGRSADGTRLVLDGSLRLSLSPSFLPFPHFPLDVWVSKGLAFFRPRLQSNEIAIINPLRQVSWPWSVAARRFASDTRVGKIPTSKTQ